MYSGWYEEAHHWGKLANVIEYFYTTRAPSPACLIIRYLNGFKLLSEFANVVSHVSKYFINFHGAKSRRCIENFIDTIAVGGWETKSLRLAENIDLIAGSKAKLTDLTSRLTYQYLYFAGLKHTGHGYHHKRDTLHRR